MNRNKQTKYEKKMLNIERTYKSMRYNQDDYVWVPVEDPNFIGWETSLVLSESGNRRSDAPYIKKALELTGLSKPYFFRKKPEVVKAIRKAKKKYVLFRSQWFETQRRSTYSYKSIEGVREIEGIRITSDKYLTFPSEIKKYFERRSDLIPASAWRDSYFKEYYKFSYKFPSYELNIKLEQAYSTHKGIPKTHLISERTKLNQKIDQELWYTKHYGKYYYSSRWIQRYQDRARRKRIKVATTLAKKTYMSDSWWNREALYNVEQIFDKEEAKIRIGKY